MPQIKVKSNLKPFLLEQRSIIFQPLETNLMVWSSLNRNWESSYGHKIHHQLPLKFHLRPKFHLVLLGIYILKVL